MRGACFGELFAPNDKQRQVGKTGSSPSRPVAGKTRRKLLKTRRLKTFQIGDFTRVFLWAVEGRK